jgi:acyl carrier protein
MGRPLVDSTFARILRVVNGKVGANLTEDELRHARRVDEVVPIDSLALLELVVGIEAEFGVTFDSDSLSREHLLDINQLIASLDRLTHQRPR